MLPRVEFRPVTARDQAALLAGLRADDLREIEASTSDTPAQAIADAVARSAPAFAIDIDGHLAALCGVAPLTADLSAPWLLGTTHLDRHPRVLARAGVLYLDAVLCGAQQLLNYVDVRSTRSVRWLRRLGFTIHPAVPYGPHGLLFHPFTMERPPCASPPSPCSRQPQPAQEPQPPQ